MVQLRFDLDPIQMRRYPGMLEVGERIGDMSGLSMLTNEKENDIVVVREGKQPLPPL